MDINIFFKQDLERDIKVLLSHHRHHKKLGQEHDDILNSVYVGSIIKGRLFLDMLGFKAIHQGQHLSVNNKRSGDINAVTLGGRFASKDDLKNGQESMLSKFLTAVNKAEAHRDGYDTNSDDIIHPSIILILNLVDKCIYQPTNRKIKYLYAQQLLNY